MTRAIFSWDADIQKAYSRKEDEICAVEKLPKVMRLFVETNYPGTQYVNFGPTCGMGGGRIIWGLWG